MNKKSAPAYTIKGRPKSTYNNNSARQDRKGPGPSDYNNDINPKLAIPPAYSIPQSKKATIEQQYDTPGPSSYQIKQMKNSNATIFNSRPQTRQKNNSPGPSDYKPNYQTVKRHIPKWKFKGQKRDTQNSQMRPGPGNYELASTMTYQNFASIKFGKQKRLDRKTVTQNTPGPGSYDNKITFFKIQGTDRPGTSFSKDKKGHQSMIKTPGPGQYLIKSFFETAKQKGKGFHLGSRCKTEINRKSITPAPGYYKQPEVNSVKKKNPAFSIQRSLRAFSTDHNPSPTHYHVNSSTLVKTGGAFNRSKSTEKKNPIPGPGAYEVPEKIIKQSVHYSFTRSSFTQPKLQKAPGPGEYNPNASVIYQSKYKSQSIGKAQRETQRVNKKTPGPGSYEFKTKNKIQVSFTHQKRLDLKIENSPGPGQYNNPSYIGNLPAYARTSKDQ